MSSKSINRALISVYDKTGIAEFATQLKELGIEILSSGGTAKELLKNNLDVIEVSDLTGFSEALDGRLKTLHPLIHGGILADLNKKSHIKDLEEIGAEPIGLVVCNLYPFLDNPSVELIDIGGPAMVRAAAKNFEHVGVIVDSADYKDVIDELKSSSAELSLETKRKLAEKAFFLTTQYDLEIANWLDNNGGQNESQNSTTSLPNSSSDSLPDKLNLNLTLSNKLRYGENPHLEGALYKIDGKQSFWDTTEQLNGKPLSYLNIYDTTAAWQLNSNLHYGKGFAAVVVKHSNPCGAAISDDILTAFSKAHECDSTSAFGGVVALSGTVSKDLAERLKELFLEVIIAQDFEPDALEILQQKKNIRLLKAPVPISSDLHIRSVENQILIQTTDGSFPDLKQLQKECEVVTSKKPTQTEWEDLMFAERIVAATTSNAIVIAKDKVAWGIGAGQQNRKDATYIATQKADGRASGGVCASDAFFPFPDGLDGAIEAGCTAIIQPGGSVNDKDVIAAAEANGLAMVLTGTRRFKH